LSIFAIVKVGQLYIDVSDDNIINSIDQVEKLTSIEFIKDEDLEVYLKRGGFIDPYHSGYIKSYNLNELNTFRDINKKLECSVEEYKSDGFRSQYKDFADGDKKLLEGLNERYLEVCDFENDLNNGVIMITNPNNNSDKYNLYLIYLHN
jgi:hypothetical protein